MHMGNHKTTLQPFYSEQQATPQPFYKQKQHRSRFTRGVTHTSYRHIQNYRAPRLLKSLFTRDQIIRRHKQKHGAKPLREQLENKMQQSTVTPSDPVQSTHKAHTEDTHKGPNKSNVTGSQHSKTHGAQKRTQQ